jgi:hypothetical protein
MISALSSPKGAEAVTVGLGSAGVGLVWYAVLMRETWAAAALSPICGHSSLIVAHCAPCYGALGLVAGGLLAAAGLTARTWRARGAKGA